MTTLSLPEADDQLSDVLLRASEEDLLITVHGRPRAVVHVFADEDEYLEYRLLNDPRFKQQIAESRAQFKRGEFTFIEDVPLKGTE